MSVDKRNGTCKGCFHEQIVKIYPEETSYCIHNTLLCINVVRNCNKCYKRSIHLVETYTCNICNTIQEKKKAKFHEKPQQQCKFYVDSIDCKGHWVVDKYCDGTCIDCQRTFCTCMGIFHCCCNGRFDDEITEKYKDKILDSIYDIFNDIGTDVTIEIYCEDHDLTDEELNKLHNDYKQTIDNFETTICNKVYGATFNYIKEYHELRYKLFKEISLFEIRFRHGLMK